jgi:hypothetical protein
MLSKITIARTQEILLTSIAGILAFGNEILVSCISQENIA